MGVALRHHVQKPDGPEYIEFNLTGPYHLHLMGNKVDSTFSPSSILYLRP